MSESVGIGAIGKNPAIDRINHINGADVKNYASSQMRQSLVMQDVPYDAFFGESTYKRAEQINFAGAGWKGEDYGNKDSRQGGREQNERKQQERFRMEGGIRFGRPNLYENTNRLGKTIGEMDRGEISIQPKATGNPYRSYGRTDSDLQPVGRAVTGRAGKAGDFGNTEKY